MKKNKQQGYGLRYFSRKIIIPIFFIPFTLFSEKLPNLPIEFFFTQKDPVHTILIEKIKSATKSIYAALYEIDYMPFAEALVEQKKKGIDIRLVSDWDYREEKAASFLLKNGIPIVFDNQKSFMHNKFIIIDGQYVWTGSVNISHNDLLRNRNNVIFIEDRKMAIEFTKEFFEMFQDKIFGERDPKYRNTLYYFRIGQTPINLFFTPENDGSHIVYERLAKAKKSILVAAFAFTHPDLEKIVLKKIKEGIEVDILLDRGQAKNKDSIYQDPILRKNIQLYQGRGKLHHKFIVIDEELVLTGSFNFSKNASLKNDENLLVIENIDLARAYIQEFYRCKQEQKKEQKNQENNEDEE